MDEEASRINIFHHAENVRIFNDGNAPKRIPVTVLTGCLGAGKTTLLNHILSHKSSNLRIAAAINDFAELNIDEQLISKTTTESSSNSTKVVELTNGCVCCHLLDDLAQVVVKLLRSGGDVETDTINYLLVETSGVTDPQSVVRTLDAKFGKCYRARLDSVVTVVDSDQYYHELTNNENEGDDEGYLSVAATSQLRCADVILLNKTDLLDTSGDGGTNNRCEAVIESIRKYNPTADIRRTVKCRVPLSAILDVEPASETGGVVPITHERSEIPFYISSTGGSLRREKNISRLSPNVTPRFGSGLNGHAEFHTQSVTLTQNSPLSLFRLSQFVTSPVLKTVARMKGILYIRGFGNQRCVLHLSGRNRLGLTLDGVFTGPPSSEIVFISKRQRTRSRQEQPQEQSQHSEYLSDSETEDDLIVRFTNCVCDSTIDPSEDSKDLRLPMENNRRWNLLAQSYKATRETLIQQLTSCNLFEVFPLEYNARIRTDSSHNVASFIPFRLTGSKQYGYSTLEIERDLRIDLHQMNIDCADAINASVPNHMSLSPQGTGTQTQPSIAGGRKAFLAYTTLDCPVGVDGTNTNTNPASQGDRSNNRITVLCYPVPDTDDRSITDGSLSLPPVGHNMDVVLDIAKQTLSTYFRNVQVCKCGV